MRSSHLLFALAASAFLAFSSGFGVVVTTTVDEDDGTLDPAIGAGTSLREAVNYAAFGTTITFTNSPAVQSITLTNGQLLLDRNVNVDASALTNGMTIDGNHSSRIFNIRSGNTNFLSSLTLTNGAVASNETGGAIIMDRSDVTLNNVTLSGNTGGRGGAIYTSRGELTIIDSVLSGNTASDNGGCIYCGGGTIALNHTTLDGNTAGEIGGGIFTSPSAGLSSVTLSNTTISANMARSSGGLYNSLAGTLTLERSTVSGNTATTSGGGGIRNDGRAILNYTTVSGNTAWRDGGGIQNFEINGSIASITLNNSTVSGNIGRDGGGIHNTLGTVNLNNATVSGNTATNTGGGVFTTSILNSTNSILAGNTAATNANLTGTITSGFGNLTSGDPLLAPPGDYGGPTFTMPPLAGSPAICAAITHTDSPITDQRGFARPNGPAPDIGAVEAYGFESLGLADTEPDGIPDIFEGPDGPYTNLTVGVDDSAVDTDGDGSTDAEEIYNMTDLNDAGDFFQILSFTPTPEFAAATNPTFSVTVKTFPGLGYALEATPLLSGFGAITNSDFTATNTTESMQVLLPPEAQEFIRAKRN